MKTLVDTEVIEQAIEALVKAAPTVFAETITNLRAALEAKEQVEPVAFAVDEVVHWHIPHKGKSFLYLHPSIDEKMLEDAEKWRSYQERRKRLLDAGFGVSPLRDAARAAEGEK